MANESEPGQSAEPQNEPPDQVSDPGDGLPHEEACQAVAALAGQDGHQENSGSRDDEEEESKIIILYHYFINNLVKHREYCTTHGFGRINNIVLFFF